MRGDKNAEINGELRSGDNKFADRNLNVVDDHRKQVLFVTKGCAGARQGEQRGQQDQSVSSKSVGSHFDVLS